MLAQAFFEKAQRAIVPDSHLYDKLLHAVAKISCVTLKVSHLRPSQMQTNCTETVHSPTYVCPMMSNVANQASNVIHFFYNA